MKHGIIALTLALLCLIPTRVRAIDPALGQFAIVKQAQIRELAGTITNKIPPLVWRFFDALRVDDWETASNVAMRINAASHRYSVSTNDESLTPALGTLIWPPISESYGAYEQFHEWNNRWLHRFGSDIIKSIPPGSIYFGGTDPGRFVVSVLCDSQVEGRPFFTLTQNQMADSTYMDYIRAMYGSKITLPTKEDVQQAFSDYAADVERRRQKGQLKPGEQVSNADGHLQISGQVSVMEINGRLVKMIFDNNPQRRFFIEESFPLDWMYPYLTPHGLIFELNRETQPEITPAEVSKDQACWQKITDEALGKWLTNGTALKEVCDFADKYGTGTHLEDYPGDKDFGGSVQTRKCYSKLRSSQAGMYAWRAQNAANNDERRRMNEAADLAYRQSYAICPYSPEAIYRYLNFLMAQNRIDDGIVMLKTSLHLEPDNEMLKSTLDKLMAYR